MGAGGVVGEVCRSGGRFVVAGAGTAVVVGGMVVVTVVDVDVDVDVDVVDEVALTAAPDPLPLAPVAPEDDAVA